MASAAHHALLDVPRVGTHLQHFEIVVRFKNQTIGITQMMFHELGQITEIGGHSYFAAIRTEREAQGICGVVRNREGRDFDIADDEFLASANVLNARESLRGSIRQDAFDLVMSGFGDVHRSAPENGRLHEATDMIGVLVRKNDAIESFGTAAEKIEAPKEL